MSQQLTLQLDGTLADHYANLRDCVAAGIHQRGLKRIAGLIDAAPSNLSAAPAGETRCLSVDQFERYIAETGDHRPILYLVERFIGMDEQQVAAARDDRIEKLLGEVKSLMAARTATRKVIK